MVTRCTADDAARHPEHGLLRRFTMVSLAVAVLATALTTYAMGWLVERYLVNRAAAETSDRLAQAMLDLAAHVPERGPLEGGLAQRFAAAAEALLVAPTGRVAFWTPIGQPLYASPPTDATLPPSQLERAAAGAVVHEVLVVDRPTGSERQLRLLVPLRSGADVTAVVELEQDFEPLAAHIAELQLFAALSLFGFASSLYLLLLRLVRRAAGRLRQLADEVVRSSAVERALLGTAQDLARLVPLDQLLTDVAARAVALLNAHDALIFLAAPHCATFTLRASHGVAPEKLAQFPFREVMPDAFPAFARVCAERQALAIEHAPGSNLLPSGLAAWYGANSCLIVPLAAGERLEGVMIVHYLGAVHRFCAEEIALAAGLAGQAAVALANARAFAIVGEVEALREMNRLKSEFVSVASHELRTPLSVVAGYAELLAARDYDPGRVRQIAAELQRETDRLSRLAQRLLDLGRLESGRLSLDLQPTDLVDVVQETAARYAVTTTRHHLLVEADTVPPLPLDRERFRQVLDNLVTNAIRYSPQGGPIRIGVSNGPRSVRVSVRDEGLGLTPEDVRRLFERFYRSPRAEVRAVDGTGLGLATAQAIVEAHGGRITATSPGHGQGSTFAVELPVAGSGGRAALAAASAGATAPTDELDPVRAALPTPAVAPVARTAVPGDPA